MQVLKDGEIDTLYFDLVIPEKKISKPSFFLS